ncbi:MAG: hypothetical protein ACPGYV_11020 [Phycisphaeraceae bacterium]
MKTALIAVVCFACGFAAQEAKETLEFDFERPAFAADGIGTIAIHFMAAKDGFSSNVNLIAQPFAGTMEAYDQISMKEFEQMGLTVIEKTNTDGVLRYHYKGVQNGLPLRFFSKAVQVDNRVYLATATTLQKEWETVSQELVRSVESFELKEAPAVN